MPPLGLPDTSPAGPPGEAKKNVARKLERRRALQSIPPRIRCASSKRVHAGEREGHAPGAPSHCEEPREGRPLGPSRKTLCAWKYPYGAPWGYIARWCRARPLALPLPPRDNAARLPGAVSMRGQARLRQRQPNAKDCASGNPTAKLKALGRDGSQAEPSGVSEEPERRNPTPKACEGPLQCKVQRRPRLRQPNGETQRRWAKTAAWANAASSCACAERFARVLELWMPAVRAPRRRAHSSCSACAHQSKARRDRGVGGRKP